MITAEEIKRYARKIGADLVGIGDIEQFSGTPKEQDPRFIAPAAKSIIGLGFRVLRGSLRGIESGTQFYQFTAMGISHLDMYYAPETVRKLCCFLEDHGYEGVAQVPVKDRRGVNNPGIDPEMEKTWKIDAKPVAAGRPAPDVIMNYNQAAYICGLGHMGMGGFFLTPEFGPLQRFAFVLTDAVLTPDPVYRNSELCDECGKCIKGCPGHAILDKKVEKKWANQKIVYNKLDEWQCAAYYIGAYAPANPFASPEVFKEFKEGTAIARGEKRLSPEEAELIKAKLPGKTYPGNTGNYSSCICGKACQRECLVHLEERGVLTRKFAHNFRTEEKWCIEHKPSDNQQI